MKPAVLGAMLLALVACSPAPVVDAYNQRAEAQRSESCASDLCEKGQLRPFHSLPPIYQAYLVLTFPFWWFGH